MSQAVLRSLAAALVVLAAILVPGAAAQVLDPSVTVSFAEASASLGPGNSTVLDGTVANGNGQVSGTVTLSFEAPAGWTVVLDPASAFTLAGGASVPFSVTVTAPVDAAPTDGALAVTASVSDQAGRSSTSAPATVALAFLAPPPPAIVPWYQTTAGIAAIFAAVLVVAAVVVALVLRSRRLREAAEAAAAAAAKAAREAEFRARETGISIASTGGPIQYGHKREVLHRVVVSNTSERPRVAVVEVAEVTNGWRAALQVTKIPLSVGETQPVTLVVTPDAVITPGDRATVVVRAKPEEAREHDERVTIDVVAPKHGVPQDPHYRIVSVHREGAGSPPIRR